MMPDDGAAAVRRNDDRVRRQTVERADGWQPVAVGCRPGIWRSSSVTV